MANGDCVTQQKLDEKAKFIYSDVSSKHDDVNKRIDKYADKSDLLEKSIHKIEITVTKILAHQEADKESNNRILDLLTSNIKTNEDDIKDNKKRINIFSGAVLAVTFLFTYLWSALKQ